LVVLTYNLNIPFILTIVIFLFGLKALKKLEESLESEAGKKSNSGDKVPSGSKRKRTNQK
jgi:hypothetical protein